MPKVHWHPDLAPNPNAPQPRPTSMAQRSQVTGTAEHQAFYAFDVTSKRWEEVPNSLEENPALHGEQSGGEREASKPQAIAPNKSELNASESPEASSSALLRIITWNIDVFLPFPSARITAALAQLRTLVAASPSGESGAEAGTKGEADVVEASKAQHDHNDDNDDDDDAALPPSSPPTMILLQEMCSEYLAHMRAAPWIRRNFFLTDIDNRNWSYPGYGTAALVDRRLAAPVRVFRVMYVSRFGRDGMFVDLALRGSSAGEGESEGEGDADSGGAEDSAGRDAEPAAAPRDDDDGGLAADNGQDALFRICNVHLDSLKSRPSRRPDQLRIVAGVLREDGVRAGVVAGDYNAIEEFDRTLHVATGLRDVYLELGGREDSADGYTWGYQSPHEKFPLCRMDKMMFVGDVAPRTLERIGVGVVVQDEGLRREMVEEEKVGPFATDHYGLLGDFVLKGVELVLGRNENEAVGLELLRGEEVNPLALDVD